MPLVKTDTTTQIEFGSGDILISSGLLQHEDVVGVLCFTQQEPRPIGDYVKNPKRLTFEETPVRFLFDTPRSIDVLIERLQKVKEYMKKGFVEDVQRT